MTDLVGWSEGILKLARHFGYRRADLIRMIEKLPAV